MVRQLKHEEIAELLGAYALDAVEPDEAELIEVHLSICPRCRAEVRDHREVASLLAYSGAPAPAGMWDALAAALDDPAPAVDPPVLAPVTPIRRSGSSWTRGRAAVFSGAVAAALMVVLAIGGLLVTRGSDTTGSGGPGSEVALERAAVAASNADGARLVRLATPDKRVLADGVITPEGTAYLWNVQLPALDEGRAYQLWAVVGDGETRSVGILGRSPRVVAFNVPTSSVVGLAVTDEVATGVLSTSNRPVVFGALSL